MPRTSVKPVLLLIILLLLVAYVQAIVPLGRITVLSSPSNANACIDTSLCDTTTATFMVEGNAWHTVAVTSPGYSPWTDLVYVTAGQAAAVSADLKMDQNATGIRIFVRPGGGNVCLDAVRCQVNLGTPGSTGSVEYTGLSPGFHTVTVDNTDGYQDYAVQARVTMGSITNLVIDLTPAAIPTSTIRVYVSPPGSTVCIDGGDCRTNVGGFAGTGTGFTDFAGVSVNIPHTISVTEDGLQPSSQQVTAISGHLTSVNFILDPVPVPTPEPTPPPASPSPLPTQASSGLLPVLGALAICGMAILYRKK